MRYQIADMSLGGILDNAIKIVQSNFGLLFGIVTVLQLPFGIVAGMVIGSMMPEMPANPDQADMLRFQKEMFSLLPIIYTILGINLLIVVPLTTGAMIHAISKAYLQEEVTIGSAYSAAFARAIPLVLTYLLIYLAVAVGFVLCVIPGIVFAIWFALSAQVVVIEGQSGPAAMGRSKELVTGNILTMLGLGIVLGIIGALSGAATNFIPNPYIGQIVGVVIQSFLTMFGSAAFVVFYFGCRSKHENFDLTVLARTFGKTISTPVAGTANTPQYNPDNPYSSPQNTGGEVNPYAAPPKDPDNPYS